MDAFRVCPELFELRSEVQAALADAGYEWMSHYSSVDPLHDVYGLEVCGIRKRPDAVAIRSLLRSMFPKWRFGSFYYRDHGREPGFRVSIFRDAPRKPDQWTTA